MDFHLDTLCFESKQKPKSFRHFLLVKLITIKAGDVQLYYFAGIAVAGGTGGTTRIGDVEVVTPLTLIFGAVRLIAVLAVSAMLAPEMLTRPSADEMSMLVGASMEMEPLEVMVMLFRLSFISIL